MSWLNLTHNTKYASDEMSVLHCATEGRMAGVPNVVGAGLGDTWESKNMNKDIVMADLTRLRNYIQEWLDANDQTWSGLFTKAGHNNGSSTVWSRGRLKGYPKVTTIWNLADAMGVPRHQLMAVAGMIPNVGPEAFQTEHGFDLSPREAALVESFRVLAEDHQSIVYNQVVAMAASTQPVQVAE